jgi:hypothetical protein
MATSGYASWMLFKTSSSLDFVREARMMSLGLWEAMERAIEEPILSGETPVMSTGLSQFKALVNKAILDLIPFFPRIWSAKAFATWRPPVSLSHSGCVKVDML